jgi:hypothetical protein
MNLTSFPCGSVTVQVEPELSEGDPASEELRFEIGRMPSGRAQALRRLFVVAALVVLCPAAAANDIYTVTATSGDGACTANSTEDPACTLPAAIAAAARI